MAKKRGQRPFSATANRKLIEKLGVVFLVVLASILAILNRDEFCSGREAGAQSASTYTPTTHAPLAQPYQIDAALKDAGFVREEGTLIDPNERAWPFSMEADADGVLSMEWVAPLFADISEDSALGVVYNRQNASVRAQQLALFEQLCPILGGSFSDAEKFTQGCEAVAKSEKAKTFRTSDYTLLIYPDTNGIRVSVRRGNE